MDTDKPRLRISDFLKCLLRLSQIIEIINSLGISFAFLCETFASFAVMAFFYRKGRKKEDAKFAKKFNTKMSFTVLSRNLG
jgi:hypothetical protein